MNKSERTLIIILRVIGFGALFAIPAIFLPFAWMNAIHKFMGLGQLPDVPIVQYLSRSLSMFYAIFGAFTLVISTDLQKYRLLITMWAILVCVMGGLLLGIDISAGMPFEWTFSEGPPAIVTGFVVLWLQWRSMGGQDDKSQ